MAYFRTRKQWGARGNGGSAIGRVSEVVGHTEAGADISPTATVAQEEQRMRAIDAFHLSLGWSGGFGYSVGVFPSGRVYEGRGYRRSGAHTQGKNSTALAFVIPGHGDRTPMTKAAISGVRRWIGQGVRDGHITADPKISGHRDYSPKSCPGNQIYPQLSQLRGVRGPESEKPETSDEEKIRADVARIRSSHGLPRDPASDEIWVQRILSGSHNLNDAEVAIARKARRERPSGGFSFQHTATIGQGSRGAAVTEWQRALRQWNPNALPRFGVDGGFGNETVDWTGRFMQATGLVSQRPSNPRVGARTRNKMTEVLGSGSSGGSSAPAPAPTFRFQHSTSIQRGSNGAAVREWQQALRRRYPNALPRFGADGDFGDETARWTARFMQDAGLTSSRPASPIVGSRTRQAMERALNR